ncbi:MAG: glucose-1-phosphate adenylyltransferase subunit GlgD [Clostridia bacterium]|nr:glucose-1-phosphate adenylyltransferase subunit GlgD [Clostridia bacterium]
MSTTGIIFSNLHDMSIADLTRKRTMASVPFGCRYRLIDFALSNMVNSGISDINVITHNNYRSLMDHLGSGKDWDLARRTGGLKVLPPFITAYSNDASALYTSRLEALKSIQGVVAGITADTVVLSDCDAICNIDLRKLIEYHNAEDADVTYAVKTVPLTAATSEHYNIVSSDENGNITDIIAHKKGVEGNFDVSINIWVFKRQYLQSSLLDAAAHGYTSFTHDIIGRSLTKQTFKAYRYDGFYANITSMADYYAINMSLLDPKNREALFKIKERPIYTKVRNSAPTKYVDGATVKNSLIADGCVIEGTVENSILFRGVRVGKNAVVKNAILFQDTQILSGAFVNCVIADKNVVVRNDVMLSGHPTMPLYIEKSKMI